MKRQKACEEALFERQSLPYLRYMASTKVLVTRVSRSCSIVQSFSRVETAHPHMQSCILLEKGHYR
jgi:hypothetical protein